MSMVEDHIETLSMLNTKVAGLEKDNDDLKKDFDAFKLERRNDMTTGRRWFVSIFVTLVLGFFGLFVHSDSKFAALYANYDITPKKACVPEKQDTIICGGLVMKGDF